MGGGTEAPLSGPKGNGVDVCVCMALQQHVCVHAAQARCKGLWSAEVGQGQGQQGQEQRQQGQHQ